MRLALAAALVSAAGLSASFATPRGPDIRRGPPSRFLVHFEDTLRNPSGTPLLDVVCEALLPLETPRQHVRWIRLSPHGWTVRTDAHGQTVATGRADEIPPGGAATFSWIASVDLAEESHAPVPAVAADPPADAARYLGDDRALVLSDPAVRAAAADVLRDCGDAPPSVLADAAARHVRANVSYELEGGWDPAPVVLARGTGSCTESVFAFAAIARSLGIPTRWTGGTLLRPGTPGRTVDARFHRIAEVWLPGHGWAPVEATGDPAHPLGAYARPFLQLSRGDASLDAGSGHAYHSRLSWTEPSRKKGEPRRGVSSKRAAWLPGIDDDEATRPVAPGTLPSFARCELLACDVRGFGGDGPGGGAASRLDAARLLLLAGHPEGLRLASEAWGDDAEGLGPLVREACGDALAEEVLPLLAGNRAAFEAWWSRRGADVVLIRSQ